MHDYYGAVLTRVADLFDKHTFMHLQEGNLFHKYVDFKY